MAIKDEQDEEQQAFLDLPSHDQRDHISPTPRKQRSLLFYLRLFLEAAMAVTICLLVAHPALDSCKSAMTRKSPVPEFPRKRYAFIEDKKYLNEDMFSSRENTTHALHNWVPLSAAARGYVQIPDRELYDLVEPYVTAVNLTHNGPAYMMSVFHQLHCLSYIVLHFQSGYAGVQLEQEVAHHSAHCFDYLRQSIMCAGDTSLEGKTEAGPGWGSKHDCVDYDALLRWTNEHGAKPWRGNMPEETIL